MQSCSKRCACVLYNTSCITVDKFSWDVIFEVFTVNWPQIHKNFILKNFIGKTSLDTMLASIREQDHVNGDTHKG